MAFKVTLILILLHKVGEAMAQIGVHLITRHILAFETEVRIYANE